MRIKGRVWASRPGHYANTEFMKQLLRAIRRDGEKPAFKYNPAKAPLLDINQIMKLLPHRYPFLLVDKILKETSAKIILVEIHAEATSEKLAMGYMLDGRVSAVWGTHTHVPTADPMILPKGTGYVTDLGMTGPIVSVIGIQPKLSIDKFRGEMYQRYQSADGPTKLNAVLFTIDANTGKCTKAERVDMQ